MRIPQMQKLAWDPVRDFTYIIGLDMVYSSACGIAGPHGMEPRIVKIPHDGFKKLWYRSSGDYAQYARETFKKERALIERLGLLAK